MGGHKVYGKSFESDRVYREIQPPNEDDGKTAIFGGGSLSHLSLLWNQYQQ